MRIIQPGISHVVLYSSLFSFFLVSHFSPFSFSIVIYMHFHSVVIEFFQYEDSLVNKLKSLLRLEKNVKWNVIKVELSKIIWDKWYFCICLIPLFNFWHFRYAFILNLLSHKKFVFSSGKQVCFEYLNCCIFRTIHLSFVFAYEMQSICEKGSEL